MCALDGVEEREEKRGPARSNSLLTVPPVPCARRNASERSLPRPSGAARAPGVRDHEGEGEREADVRERPSGAGRESVCEVKNSHLFPIISLPGKSSSTNYTTVSLSLVLNDISAVQRKVASNCNCIVPW